jgi:AmmeMemoRadiSam system protein A
VLRAARLLGADQFPIIAYANSGDIPGAARDRVVGYCAVAACRSGTSAGAARTAAAGELTAKQQERLLSLARSAIEAYVRSDRVVAITEADAALLRPGAAFVTLRRHGQLRGCIGSIEAVSPLAETVRDRAIHAASADPRFPPVSAAELSDLEIEISVLSPLRKVATADEIELGKHGVIVRSGRRSGVFLPQVAEETGWSRDEFLTHLCRDKAGLPANAWKRDADLFVFTVQAFSSPAPSEKSNAGS